MPATVAKPPVITALISDLREGFGIDKNGKNCECLVKFERKPLETVILGHRWQVRLDEKWCLVKIIFFQLSFVFS